MTQGHPVVERYLTSFEASIDEFDFPEREEITHEIRNHIAEARAAGTALDAVLQALGPAEVLARAYAAELALNPHSTRRVGAPGRFLTAIVAAGTRPVRTLGRFLTTAVAAGPRRVWTLVRFLTAAVATGPRRVWALVRILTAAVATGPRRVWAVSRFLAGVVSAGMRRVWAGGGFLMSAVASSMRHLWAFGGFLKVAALVVAGSVAALIVGTTIGAIGIGFTLSGLFMLVVGILEAAGLHMADVQINDMSPAVAMTLSPMVMVAGGAALMLLWFYLQFVVTTLQRVFPTARGTALARAFST